MSLAVGVIGAGVMGSEHARILREETRGARLAAVCDADEARARSVASGGAVHADPLALIRSDAVDAVVIASPDATHAELALACIEADKPVLCEKPVAATSSEALRVVEAEVAKGRRLVQVGYMRRFDPGYIDMKCVLAEGEIGHPLILHNVHRNAVVPEWFTGAMLITNAFVHEIDATRWLLDAELVSVDVHASRAGDPLLIVTETDRGTIVSTEVYMSARYGYHVGAELVGSEGTVQTAVPTRTLVNRDGRHGHVFPSNWIPRFREAYANQMNAWVEAARAGTCTGAGAWDGYVVTAIAEQVVAALDAGTKKPLVLEPRPALYSV